MIRPDRAFRVLIALLVLAGLAACSAVDAEKPVRRLFSPNGEPLNGGKLGLPSCEDAYSGWFDRLDSAHRGVITETAFLDDARRQFRVMDLNHDGVVTPAELAVYRAPYAIPRKKRAGAPEWANTDERAAGGGARPRDPDLLADFSDPVMIADSHFRNVVSEADFLAYEHRNFIEMNRARNGRLGREELLRGCETE